MINLDLTGPALHTTIMYQAITPAITRTIPYAEQRRVMRQLVRDSIKAYIAEDKLKGILQRECSYHTNGQVTVHPLYFQRWCSAVHWDGKGVVPVIAAMKWYRAMYNNTRWGFWEYRDRLLNWITGSDVQSDGKAGRLSFITFNKYFMK